MKKVLSLVSVTLSLVLIAATIFVVPTFAASGSTVGENLLANPELNYTDNGDGTYTVEGWTISKPTEYLSHSVYTENNENVVVLQSINIDKAIAITTKSQLSLSKDKYYKFSVWLKLEAPDMLDSSGNKVDFNCNQTYPGAYMFYKFNGQDAYRSTAIKAVSDWQEYSFIIRGSEVGNGLSSVWDKYCGVKLYGIKGKLSVKKPSVVEYTPDTITVQDRVEAENILPVGIQGFTVPDDDKGVYISHQNTTVELNGVDNVPAIAVETASLQEAYRINYTLKNSDTATNNLTLTGGKKYKFSAWVKVESTGHSDITTYGVSAQFCHGNNWSYDNLCQTFGEWQKVEKIIDVETFPWKYLVGISIYATGGTTYIADVRLEEFVGEITVSEQNAAPQNIIANGDFEVYNTENTNIFSGWIFSTNSNVNNVHTVADGVSGKALKFTNASQDYPYTGATTTVDVDSAKDYVLSAKVKVTEPTNGTWGTVSWGGGVRLQITEPNSAISEIRSNEINYKTTDWVTLTANINDLPESVTKLNIKIISGSTGCDVYIDDVELVPVAGGTLNIDRTNANTGDTVYLSAVADEGYYLDSVSYNDGVTEIAAQKVQDVVLTSITSKDNAAGHIGNGYSQIASDCIYQFTMPAENITVKAVFKEIIIGDINGDEVVDIRDLVRLVLYLGDDTTTIATVNADVNGNGTIEAADVAELRETLLNQ